jgi:hypothetical protein
VTGAGKPFYGLTVVQLRGLLLADAVRAAFAQAYRTSQDPLSCDRDLPVAGLVAIDQPTRYRCAAGTALYRVGISLRKGTVQPDTTALEFFAVS